MYYYVLIYKRITVSTIESNVYFIKFPSTKSKWTETSLHMTHLAHTSYGSDLLRSNLFPSLGSQGSFTKTRLYEGTTFTKKVKRFQDGYYFKE